MFRRNTLTLLASLVAVTAAPLTASAQLPTPQTSSMPRGANLLSLIPWHAQSLLVVAGDPNAATYATPKGAGYDGIGSIFIDIGNNQGYLCSGALLAGGQYMLTAAHCLSDGTSIFAQQSLSVFFPPGAPATTREIITSTEFYVHPQYTGEVIDAHDIALIKLGTAPSAGILAGARSLYGGNGVGQGVQLVGSGTTGNGIGQGGGGFTLPDRRTGLNRIDLNWDDPNWGGTFYNFFGSADPATLVGDFDNGSRGNDASCWLSAFFLVNNSQYCDLGQGSLEASLGPGDSGGPLFINGLIAGVASYSLSFGLDPDIDNALNSSYGEFAGWTSVDYNRGWIDSYVAPRQVVPEPATLVLTLVGASVLFAVQRRRKG